MHFHPIMRAMYSLMKQVANHSSSCAKTSSAASKTTLAVEVASTLALAFSTIYTHTHFSTAVELELEGHVAVVV